MGKLNSVAQHCGAISDKRDGATLRALLDPIDNALSNRVLNAPGLAIGSGSKKKILIANNVLCVIKGKHVAVATQEVAFTATTHDITGDSGNAYILQADAAGTVTITMGIEAAALTGVVYPLASNDQAVLGIVTIDTTTTKFDATSDDLDAGHLAVKYYDCTGAYCTK